jgi:hypothetical protein
MQEEEEGGSRIKSGMTPDRGPGQAGVGDPRWPAAVCDSHEATADKGRIHAGRHRDIQIVRTSGRKLFDEAAKTVFLDWFASTCNLSWAAEMAGFNYKTVLRHRMNDADFAADFDRAMEQGYARLEAKRLETKRQPLRIGIEGDWDAPETADMPDERIDAILRERGRQLAGEKKAGRRPKVASNAEVREALAKRLRAFRERIRARSQSSGADAPAGEEAPPPSFGRSPSPSNDGEDL